MTLFDIETVNIPPALRAQVTMLMREMKRRNKDVLLSHMKLVDKYAELFHQIAEHAQDHVTLTREEVQDLTKCAAVAFALNHLGEGVIKFMDVIRFQSSWEEKMELLRLTSIDAQQTKQ